MISILQSKWTALGVGIVLYSLTTYATLAPKLKLAAARPKPSAIETALTLPPWSLRDQEVDQLVNELKEQKEALGAREKQLNELAARIQADRQEVSQITQAVVQLQFQFDQNVTRVHDEEITNLKKLAKIYAEMAPAASSAVFKQMEDNSIVKILMFMKDTETAPILESLAGKSEADAKRVADLTERLRLVLHTPAGKSK